MRSEHKQLFIKIASTWLAFAAAVAAIYMFFLLPVHRKRIRIRNEVQKQTALFNHASELISKNSLHSSQDRLIKCKERFERFVTASDKATDLALAISEIAEELGIRDLATRGRTGWVLSEIPNCETILMSRIEISWNGTYRQFVRLVSEFERHRPVILIDKFVMEPSNRSDKLNEFNMHLAVLVEQTQTELDDAAVQTAKSKSSFNDPFKWTGL